MFFPKETLRQIRSPGAGAWDYFSVIEPPVPFDLQKNRQNPAAHESTKPNGLLALRRRFRTS
jgi:hypothetical protein